MQNVCGTVQKRERMRKYETPCEHPTKLEDMQKCGENENMENAKLSSTWAFRDLTPTPGWRSVYCFKDSLKPSTWGWEGWVYGGRGTPTPPVA